MGRKSLKRRQKAEILSRCLYEATKRSWGVDFLDYMLGVWEIYGPQYESRMVHEVNRDILNHVRNDYGSVSETRFTQLLYWLRSVDLSDEGLRLADSARAIVECNRNCMVEQWKAR